MIKYGIRGGALSEILRECGAQLEEKRGGINL